MDFPYFNIDLIYGIKGQTVESFLYSLEEALRFQPNELFIYPLYVRQGTGITEREPDDVCFRIVPLASYCKQKAFCKHPCGVSFIIRPLTRKSHVAMK